MSLAKLLSDSFMLVYRTKFVNSKRQAIEKNTSFSVYYLNLQIAYLLPTLDMI